MISGTLVALEEKGVLMDLEIGEELSGESFWPGLPSWVLQFFLSAFSLANQMMIFFFKKRARKPINAVA